MRLRRRPKTSPDEKPYLVTIHAHGDQHHTYRMGPGDAIGAGTIRVDIAPDGSIHATPLEQEPDYADAARHIRDQLLRAAQRNGPQHR